MYVRNAILALSLLVGLGGPVRADILILKDGGHVSGKVTKDGDTVIIITDDSRRLSFSKDEYKRIISESLVSDLALGKMFDDLAALLTTVLDRAEPSPREFLKTWDSYAEDIGRIRQRSGSIRTRSDIPQPPDTETFLHDWTRYTGYFLATRDNSEYKKLMRRRKGSGSLSEYARDPRVERADIAEALRAAINAFDNCLELADTTDRLVKLLPKTQAKHDEGIREARDNYIAKEGEREAATDRRAAQSRANEAFVRYQKRRRDMQKDMQRSINNARAKINDFAQARELARMNIAGARKLIKRLSVPPGGGGDAASTALRQARQLTDRHWLAAQAQSRSRVQLEVLRERTLARIQKVFVGRTFALRLTVNEHGDSHPGGYHLRAEDCSADSGKCSLSVDLHVLNGAKGALIKCEKGDEVELVARISQVSLSPSLPVLELSGEEPAVLLTGEAVTITSGCRP